MAKINDRRSEESKNNPNPRGFVVFTDSFMSGWGEAPGRSLYALQVETREDAYRVLESGKRRSEMQRGRFVRTLKNIRLRRGDHLSIADKTEAGRWYEPDGFGEPESD